MGGGTLIRRVTSTLFGDPTRKPGVPRPFRHLVDGIPASQGSGFPHIEISSPDRLDEDAGWEWVPDRKLNAGWRDGE